MHRFFAVAFFFLMALSANADEPLFAVAWPTPNRAFIEGGGLAEFIQPTESGELASGMFGCVRNRRTRFHEGIDLKAIERAADGTARDLIFAAFDGEVAYINDTEQHSGYGIYVVLSHREEGLTYYTLYAHLRVVREGLTVGQRVASGDPIGVMGVSAGGYEIPESRAHLHFEMGFALADAEGFRRWYEGRDFDDPNQHGRWNGMNLVGIDPLRFYQAYRAGQAGSPGEYIRRLPIAFEVEVPDPAVPILLSRNRSLIVGPLAAGDRIGWRIAFSAEGLPVRWTPVLRGGGEARFAPSVRILDEAFLADFSCRQLAMRTSSEVEIRAGLRTILTLMFD